MRFDATYNNTSANPSGLRFDSAGAHGIIQRIRVFSGSNLLEDIDNYGLLAKLLITTQISCPSNKTKFNILAGTRSDYISYLTAAAYAQFGINPVVNVQSGEVLPSSTYTQYSSANNMLIPNIGQVAATTSSITRTYCLNLISIVGSLCQSKYFPLFACGSAPLRLEVWLVDQINKCACVTSNTGTVIDKC
jgi:hypothetical protein